MHVRWAIALAIALVVALATGRAYAWQEAHQTADDQHIVVDAHGVAAVEDELHWHVVRGPLRAIDLVDFDPSAVVEPAVSVAADDGRTLSAHAARRDERTLRITIDEPRAFARGNFTFDLRWRVDLIAAREIARDGATVRMAWSAPAALDGFDNAHVTVDLPASPEGPVPIVAETGAIDDSAVATLRCGPERDVLDLVRPHVARGESVAWTLRVDPRALPLVVDPRVRPPSDATLPPEPDRVRAVSLGALLATLALGFGLLVAYKARTFAALCASAGGHVRGLLPWTDRTRAALAGVALAAAVGLEVVGETAAGAACAALATLAAALRAPVVAPPVRGPGRWQALRPEKAFASPAATGQCLDIGSAAGRGTALGAAGIVIAVAWLLRRFEAEAPWLVALDAAAIVPLFVTGCAAQLPPHGAQSAAPWLSRVFRRLGAAAGTSVTPWARVAPDGVTADELRLLVMPRSAMPGVVGVEVGLAWSRTPVRWAATPEVLARVREGSAAAARLALAIPEARAVAGRRADERVVRLLPRAPTRSSTVALVQALAETLADRRASSPAASPRTRRPATAPLRAAVRSADAIERRVAPQGSEAPEDSSAMMPFAEGEGCRLRAGVASR